MATGTVMGTVMRDISHGHDDIPSQLGGRDSNFHGGLFFASVKTWKVREKKQIPLWDRRLDS